MAGVETAPRADAADRRRWPRRLGLAALVLVALAAAAGALRTDPVEPPAHLARHRPVSIAHRGASGTAPENTLPAFERAVAAGADAIEMDVQLSADGEPVIIHDGTVDRTTDGTGRVAELTVDELQALDAGHAWTDEDGDTPFRGRGIRIPTLAEAFEALPQQFVLLELKSDPGAELADAVADAVADAIAAHDRGDRVLVAAADAPLLERFRDRAPGVPTAIAEDRIRTLYRLHLAGLHQWWRPRGVVVSVPEHHEGRRVVDERFVGAAHDLGLQVHVWTVNAPEDMRRLLELGVDGIVTDHPERLEAARRRLGLAK